jgi:preprotein translocase subunit SecG
MSDKSKASRSEIVSMAAGMLIGAITGAAIWLTTDTFVFFPVFIGVGLVLGLALKEANEKRNKT